VSEPSIYPRARLVMRPVDETKPAILENMAIEVEGEILLDFGPYAHEFAKGTRIVNNAILSQGMKLDRTETLRMQGRD